MTSPLNRLFAELDVATQLVNHAKRDFLSSLGAYGDRGESLEGVLAQYLERTYLAPENNRSVIVKKEAQSLIDSSLAFRSTTASVTSAVSTLLTAVNVAGGGFLVDSIRSFLEAVPAAPPSQAKDRTRRTIDDVEAMLKGFDAAQTKQIVLLARGIAILRAAAQAQTLATAGLKVRQSMLEAYLQETRTVQAGAAIGAVSDVLFPAVRDEMFEQVLEAGGRIIGAAAESIFPLLKIATIGYELQKSLDELNNRFKRGDVDDMLDLSVQISDALKTADDTLEHIHTVTDAILKQ